MIDSDILPPSLFRIVDHDLVICMGGKHLPRDLCPYTPQPQ